MSGLFVLDLDSFTCRGDNDTSPWAWPVWAPGAVLSSFKEDYLTLLQTNIKALGLMVLEKLACAVAEED